MSDEGLHRAGAPAESPPSTEGRLTGGDPRLAFLRAILAAARDPPAVAALAAGNGRALDGEALRQLIERERVGPLLHRALNRSGTLSPATCAALRDSYRATAMRNLVFLNELDGCLKRLAAAGVAAVVLKGAALAKPVYGSLALRPMSDLDILVQRRDMAGARAVVEDLGFHLSGVETHSGVLVEYENALAFTKPGAVCVDLDVHWSLLDSPFYQRELAMEWFWNSARVQPLGGFSAPTLGPEALLLHLCAHLMLHHQGTRLLWWNDIAQVLHVERRSLNWDEVFDRSRAYQLLLPMREALAAEWIAPIPPEVLRRFAAARPSAAEADLFQRLSVKPAAGRRFWTDLRSMANWRQGLHFARTNLLPSAAYMRARYRISHPWLVPLYYPYRWLRGVRGAGSRPL